MALPPVSDDAPAWVKGDLPAEPAEPAAHTGTPAPDAEAAGAASQLEAPPEAEPAGVPPEPEPNLEPEPAAPVSDSLEATQDAPEALVLPPSDELPPGDASTPSAEQPPSDEVAPSDEPLLFEPEPPAAIETLEAVPAPTVAEVSPGPELPIAAEPLSLEAQIESLLFVADGAVTVARLAEALEVSNRDVEAALTSLTDGYHQRGLSLQRFRDKVQLTTSPSAASRVERFLGLAAASPLSRAALETLAIVAYQQPVTRPQIEAVRGVNSDSVIKNLLGKGLIEESGRAEGPGRPVLYTTTSEFMQHFGIASLGDLPPLALPASSAVPSPERILKG